MGNRSFRTTCLAENGKDLVTYEHDNRIQDITLHYLGCLRVSEQAAFFTQLPKKCQRRLVNEVHRIERLRSLFESSTNAETRTTLNGLREGAKDWFRHDRKVNSSLNHDEVRTLEMDEEIKVGIISLENGRPYNIPGLDSEFPNQIISIKDLLSENPDANPLVTPCEENTIRHIHLPANNMIWVEEAMARYYNERRRKDDDCFWVSGFGQKSKAQMALRPELWHGQQHGDGNAEVHARHMRPLCDSISSCSERPSDIVLFMHYLHWETDRGRSRSATIIKEAGKAQFPTLAEVVEEATANEHPSAAQSLPQNEINPSIQRRRGLAKMLFYAAKLSEAMDSYSNERLIYETLHEDPPLHPRRTLDQSYYGALKNTQTRDRDQVVYRATTPDRHDCVRNEDGKCAQCQEDIKMVPRVIMVDQLWMWILDERAGTIITSFPHRWGRKNDDPSAVYKSIQTRLAATAEGDVRTVYDLALIVVDHCSRVFFDRSKPVNKAPKLVDIFADAIRGVTYKQTAAFDQFLTYTHLASNNFNAKDNSGNTAMQNALLNINPEGNLLKEVKDILDELHIMIRIQIQQLAVATSFVDRIKRLLQPKITDPGDPWAEMLNGIVISVEDQSKRREEFQSAKRTVARADGLVNDIQDRIAELKTLEESANDTSTALKDLLTLKQQQASVIEAREAVKQATETLKQGRSIMLFTVVTIIFLPLGFCASVFGMNTAEFNGGLLNLHEEFYYMFPISMAIILTSFILAFSSSTFLSSLFSLIWVMVSYPVNIGLTWVLTRSGMFTMSRRLAGKAKIMKDRERGKTGLMMAEAMREKMDLKEKIEGWSQGPGEVIDVGRKVKEKVKGVGKGIMKTDIESLGSAEV